jgi:hypothetical protein
MHSMQSWILIVRSIFRTVAAVSTFAKATVDKNDRRPFFQISAVIDRRYKGNRIGGPVGVS